MAQRTQILSALAEALSHIPQVRISRAYRYLSDINSFPTICFGGTPVEDYTHISSRRRLHVMQQLLRGYVYTSDSDSLSDSEQLGRDIEQIVNRFRPAQLHVYDARVTRFSTDEGLLTPYGICDIQLEISYESTY